MDVSRHHISLKPLGEGKWQIKNLNEQNVTFVNGLAVENKVISEQDHVELGKSHYLFLWDAAFTHIFGVTCLLINLRLWP